MQEGLKLLDVQEVATVLRVSPYTVRRWAAAGKFPIVKLGSRTLFDPAEIAKFVETAREASGKQAIPA
jgi:excisionase family DNA binding protein